MALRPDGTRVPTRAKLSLVREDYHCSYSSGYRSYSTCTTKHEPIMSRDIEIPASGSGTERIVPRQPGEYVIRVETKDAKGAAVASSSYVWVLGKGEAFWSGEEDARMSLIASKTGYKAGETARLVPRTSMKNPTALVTLERNGILSARVISLEDSAQGIQLRSPPSTAPNVFAASPWSPAATGQGERNRPLKMGVVDCACRRPISPGRRHPDEKETYQRGRLSPAWSADVGLQAGGGESRLGGRRGRAAAIATDAGHDGVFSSGGMGSDSGHQLEPDSAAQRSDGRGNPGREAIRLEGRRNGRRASCSHSGPRHWSPTRRRGALSFTPPTT